MVCFAFLCFLKLLMLKMCCSPDNYTNMEKKLFPGWNSRFVNNTSQCANIESTEKYRKHIAPRAWTPINN